MISGVGRKLPLFRAMPILDSFRMFQHDKCDIISVSKGKRLPSHDRLFERRVDEFCRDIPDGIGSLDSGSAKVAAYAKPYRCIVQRRLGPELGVAFPTRLPSVKGKAILANRQSGSKL